MPRHFVERLLYGDQAHGALKRQEPDVEPDNIANDGNPDLLDTAVQT
jgi:hypothetical protein